VSVLGALRRRRRARRAGALALTSAGAQVAPARVAGLALGVAVATALAYWPVHAFGFLHYDDPLHVTDNPFVQAGLTRQGIAFAFTSLRGGNWYPLTWLSHMLDVSIAGLDPGWHHVANVAIHIASALVLLAALARMMPFAPGRSALVAALFALHPLHVESVAWISERKDVLSGLFWMLGLYAYARYAERPSGARFAAVALAFACGLASKAMVVSFPLVLLMLDAWPLGRFERERAANLVREKLPLFVGSLLFAALTFLAQSRAGAMSSAGALPLGVRVSQALLASVAYMEKAIWPQGLAIFYPYPSVIALWKVACAAALLLAVSALALRARKTHPYLAVGWLWYLVTLAPVIGLVQVGLQAMADRYTYLPLVGLFLAAVFGAHDLLGASARGSRARAPLALAVVVACAVLTRIQVGVWRDDIALYQHALAVTRDNFLAHNNLAMELVGERRYVEAREHLREALRIQPSYPDARNNLAGVLLQEGRTQEAIEELRAAVASTPAYAPAHRNLAAVLQQTGRRDEAAEHLREAERLEASGPP
jgi:protein O-mannosyl-transferase